jgi:hypothetical protein
METRMMETTWNGETWKVYRSGYFTNSRLKHLHRAKWEKLRGPIPTGHHIHHKDHDKLNNRISNLECISAGEHARRHMQGFVVTAEHQAKMQAGRRNNIVAYEAKRKASLAARPNIVVICQWCEKSFEARRTNRRTCSQYCRDQKRYYKGKLG